MFGENDALFKNNFDVSNDQLTHFKNEGYLIFEAIIENKANNILKRAIDILNNNEIKNPYQNDDLSKIIINKKLNNVVKKIMNGFNYHFHHLHAACHTSGMPSLAWHHDYEQYKERGEKHTMIHIFLYLNGLNGEIGDLLVIPGSHNENLKRYEYSSKDFEFFKNCKRLNNISEGSVIIINSKLLHARQARPGGNSNPRYFIDLSFCQSGVKWPPYREIKDWRNMLPFLQEKYKENILSSSLFEHMAFELNLRDKIIDKFKLNNIKKIIGKLIGNNGKRLN